VARNGVKDSGCEFRLAHFRPASGLNDELPRLDAPNLFSVVPQLRFSEQSGQSLDLALSLNGPRSSPANPRTP
jgi:type I restriction enzyme R subunit